MSNTGQESGTVSFDMILSGGEVMLPEGLRRADLAITGERIAAIIAAGQPVAAVQEIDVSGKLILPGAIDAHVHFRDPGLTHKEDFVSGTQAAALGGVTTVMVMPTDTPWTLTAEDLIAKRALLEGRAHVDVALQAAIAGDLSNLEQIEALAAAGAISFELFLGDVPEPYVMRSAGALQSALSRIASVGGVAGISPAEDTVIASALAPVMASGARDLASFFATRPVLSEVLGTARACLVAQATGARVHLRQMSSAAALAVLAQMRAQSPDLLTAEVTPHNLLLTAEAATELGPFAKVLPPLRDTTDLAACWHALADGVIDIVATDHAPHAPEEKRAGLSDIWQAPGGFPGVQTMVPLLLDSAAAGRIAYTDIARLVSATPARIFGLSDRKGAIEPGKDADLMIVDPAAITSIRNSAQMSRAGITPFDGRPVRGEVVATLLRGAFVMRDGALRGPARGAFIAPRQG